MLGVTVTGVGPPLTVVGKDVDVDATFNADVALGTGRLKAGTIMKYTAATLTLAADPTASAPFGLLADGFDDTGSATALPALV
jgi:hypothetical protein